MTTRRIVLAVLVPMALAACASLDAPPLSTTLFDPAEVASNVEPSSIPPAVGPEAPEGQAQAPVEVAVPGPIAEVPIAEDVAPGVDAHPVAVPHPRWTPEASGSAMQQCGPNGDSTVAGDEPHAFHIDAPTAPSPPATTSAPRPIPERAESDETSIDSPAATGSAQDTDLWQRLRNGFALPDLAGPRVRMNERWYATRPEYVRRVTERASLYLFHIVQEVERRGLPTELALLPFIESAFNPEALSSARASGIWQFIPSTGRNFDLKQNVFRDDRRDVLASTRAALDYLETLHRMFGDWHLALAAYNWGEGNVARAITRNRKAGKPTNYVNLRMPRETQSYVPKLQAVKNIVARPAAFGLVLPELADHPYFLSVPIENDIDVELAATLAGLSVEDFRALNPQMNKPVILAAGTPQVLLPYDSADRFARDLALHPGPLSSWTAWVTPRTLEPAKAARQLGMSEAELRRVNAIPHRGLIRAGSTLLVPRLDNHDADVSEHLADNGRMMLVPNRARIHRTSVTVRTQAARRVSARAARQPYRTAQRVGVRTSAATVRR